MPRGGRFHGSRGGEPGGGATGTRRAEGDGESGPTRRAEGDADSDAAGTRRNEGEGEPGPTRRSEGGTEPGPTRRPDAQGGAEGPTGGRPRGTTEPRTSRPRGAGGGAGPDGAGGGRRGPQGGEPARAEGGDGAGPRRTEGGEGPDAPTRAQDTSSDLAAPGASRPVALGDGPHTVAAKRTPSGDIVVSVCTSCMRMRDRLTALASAMPEGSAPRARMESLEAEVATLENRIRTGELSEAEIPHAVSELATRIQSAANEFPSTVGRSLTDPAFDPDVVRAREQARIDNPTAFARIEASLGRPISDVAGMRDYTLDTNNVIRRNHPKENHIQLSNVDGSIEVFTGRTTPSPTIDADYVRPGLTARQQLELHDLLNTPRAQRSEADQARIRELQSTGRPTDLNNVEDAATLRGGDRRPLTEAEQADVSALRDNSARTPEETQRLRQLESRARRAEADAMMRRREDPSISQGQRNKATERLGELAADEFMANRYPNAERIVPDPRNPVETRGSGVPDAIYRDPGPPVRFFVVEAKGGTARNTSTRELDVPGQPDPQHVQQGHREYLQSILDNPRTTRGMSEAAVAELQQAAARGTGISYLEVSQKITEPNTPRPTTGGEPTTPRATLGDIQARQYDTRTRAELQRPVRIEDSANAARNQPYMTTPGEAHAQRMAAAGRAPADAAAPAAPRPDAATPPRGPGAGATSEASPTRTPAAAPADAAPTTTTTRPQAPAPAEPGAPTGRRPPPPAEPGAPTGQRPPSPTEPAPTQGPRPQAGEAATEPGAPSGRRPDAGEATATETAPRRRSEGAPESEGAPPRDADRAPRGPDVESESGAPMRVTGSDADADLVTPGATHPIDLPSGRHRISAKRLPNGDVIITICSFCSRMSTRLDGLAADPQLSPQVRKQLGDLAADVRALEGRIRSGEIPEADVPNAIADFTRRLLTEVSPNITRGMVSDGVDVDRVRAQEQARIEYDSDFDAVEPHLGATVPPLPTALASRYTIDASGRIVPTRPAKQRVPLEIQNGRLEVDRAGLALNRATRSQSASLRPLVEKLRAAGALADATPLLERLYPGRFPGVGDASGLVSKAASSVDPRTNQSQAVEFFRQLSDVAALPNSDALLGNLAKMSSVDLDFVSRLGGIARTDGVPPATRRALIEASVATPDPKQRVSRAERAAALDAVDRIATEVAGSRLGPEGTRALFDSLANADPKRRLATLQAAVDVLDAIAPRGQLPPELAGVADALFTAASMRHYSKAALQDMRLLAAALAADPRPQVRRDVAEYARSIHSSRDAASVAVDLWAAAGRLGTRSGSGPSDAPPVAKSTAAQRQLIDEYVANLRGSDRSLVGETDAWDLRLREASDDLADVEALYPVEAQAIRQEMARVNGSLDPKKQWGDGHLALLLERGGFIARGLAEANAALADPRLQSRLDPKEWLGARLTERARAGRTEPITMREYIGWILEWRTPTKSNWPDIDRSIRGPVVEIGEARAVLNRPRPMPAEMTEPQLARARANGLSDEQISALHQLGLAPDRIAGLGKLDLTPEQIDALGTLGLRGPHALDALMSRSDLPALARHAQAMERQRAETTRMMGELESHIRQEHARRGDPLPDDAEVRHKDLSAWRAQLTEVQGERALTHVMLTASALANLGGSGRSLVMARGFEAGTGFDQVWVLRDADGTIREIFVGEAKGPTASLATGQMGAQWVRDSVAKLPDDAPLPPGVSIPGQPQITTLKAALEHAMANGTPPVRGVVVTGKVGDENGPRDYHSEVVPESARPGGYFQKDDT